MVIPLTIAMVIVAVVVLFLTSHHRESDYYEIKRTGSWREDNPDGSFTIYDSVCSTNAFSLKM